MPLNASLERMENNQFNLTVPPVKFFNLEVSPMVYCDVLQTDDSVVITSEKVVLSGSPYVVGLNGCFKINILSTFNWKDTAEKRSILTDSRIYVRVDPPPPFKFFPRRVLETTGSLAMSIALNQIGNSFVESLAKDYDRWATDGDYRTTRALGTCEVFKHNILIVLYYFAQYSSYRAYILIFFIHRI